MRALAAAADEQIKIQRMKYLANKDEILETARQQASVDQKKEQTMKKQKTSVHVTINKKMGQQSQEKAIAASDHKNQRQEKVDKPVLKTLVFLKRRGRRGS